MALASCSCDICTNKCDVCKTDNNKALVHHIKADKADKGRYIRLCISCKDYLSTYFFIDEE